MWGLIEYTIVKADVGRNATGRARGSRVQGGNQGLTEEEDHLGNQWEIG